jgi:hypothetical protein
MNNNISKKDLMQLYKDFCSKTTIKDLMQKFNINIDNLHNYSFNNYIIAYIQSANKENFNFRMGGFLEWKKRGLTIKKGEKALYVFTPMFYKQKQQQEDNETKEEKFLKTFTLKPVFDFSQTNEFKVYEKVIYESKTEIPFNTLFNFIKLNSPDIKINIDNGIKERGYFNTITKEIFIKDNQDKNTYTLLHEYAHFLTHNINDIKDLTIKGNYAKNEIIAEITSYLIAKKFFKQNEFNFNYSQIWNSNLNEFNLNEFNKLLNKVLFIIGELKQ